MDMKNPAHPGRLVKDEIEALGFSTAEAAKGLGVTRQQLHNVIAGRSSITPEMALRLEQAIGSTADTWLRMQSNYDLSQLRQQGASFRVKRLEPATLHRPEANMLDRKR